jgi:hypothetical protein
MISWTHSDIDLAARLARADQRCVDGAWDQGTTQARADELRAILVGSSYLQARLVGTTTLTGDKLVIEPGPNPSPEPERMRAAQALAATWTVLAQGAKPPGVIVTSVRSDTGALPAVAAVAVVAIAVAGVAYCAYQASDIVDRQLARLMKARELVRVDQELRGLVNKHTEAEEKAGKALPLSPAISAAIDLLKTRQAEALKELPTRTDPSSLVTEAVPWLVGAVVIVLLAREMMPALRP